MSSKFKKRRTAEDSDSKGSTVIGLNLSSADDGAADVNVSDAAGRATVISYLRRHLAKIGIAAIVLVLGLGIMARNNWLPSTDGATGKRTGWFGSTLPKNASSSWNPLAAPLPTATPQLSKEYVYAGSRLLTVEDANANAAPPADLAVWRPSNGYFYVLGGPGSQQTFFQWGQNGDIPVAGDFDGDGKTDFSLYRESTGVWWVTKSSDNSYYTVQFGATCTPPNNCDKPVTADFDGDGKSDVAVYRSSTGTWYYVRSSDQVFVATQFGLSTDTPAPADYDGDGKADITVWRGDGTNHSFYTTRSSDSTLQPATFGNSGDKPVSADYDGDGKANYAVRSGASWIILNAAMSSTSTTTPSGDASDDIPVQNDYDGDGKCDIAVWRPSNGTWYIRQTSNSSTRTVQWGTNGDIPVPAYYRR